MNICCVLLISGLDIGDYNEGLLKEWANNCTKHNVDIKVYNKPDFKELKRKWKFRFNHNKDYIGSTFLTLFESYNDKYDYYIFYEEDVVCNKNIFNEINFDYDFIFMVKPKIDYEWFWYKFNHIQNIKRKGYKPYSSLLNLYALNKKTLKDLMNFVKEGNYAHHEYLINSFIMNNNKYKIGYLSDMFKIFTDWRRLKNKKYNDYDIVHPIKSLDEFNKKIL